jgi:hypothetical protein
MKRGAIALAFVILAAPSLAVAGPDEPAFDEERGWYAGARGASAKFAVGPAVHRLYSVGVVSADMQVALGAQTSIGGWYVTLGGRVGSTDGGLGFRQFGLGVSWEMPVLDRAALGLGGAVSYLAIDRASTDGELQSLGLGGNVFGTYDLWRGDDAAIFAGLQAGLDVYSPVLWGGGARIGVRLF